MKGFRIARILNFKKEETDNERRERYVREDAESRARGCTCHLCKGWRIKNGQIS